jgi:hypothetical protein
MNLKTVGVLVAIAAVVSLGACTAAGAPTDDAPTGSSDGDPQVSVSNITYVPLRNVQINDVDVGSFRADNVADEEPIEVTIPRSETYTLTAEVDSSAGEVFSFSYELESSVVEEGTGGTVLITLPETLIALWIIDSDLTLLDDPDIDITYGSFSTSGQPDQERFLGVFSRLGTSGTMDITWTNNSWNLDASESLRIWGYFMGFNT